VREASSIVDVSQNKIIAHPDHFSKWAVLGNTNKVFLPLTELRFQPPRASLQLHLDESKDATTIMDSSGYGNVGSCTPPNCPTFGQAGVSGTSAWFDGIDDVIVIPDADLLDNARVDKLTVEAWIKMDLADCGFCRIVSKYDPSSSVGYIFDAADGNGSSKLTFFVIDGNLKSTTRASTPMMLNTWHHVVAVFSRSSTQTKLYIDGSEVEYELQTQIKYIGDLSNSSPVTIGWQPSDDSAFSGLIDEVVFYRYILSDSEIARHYWENVPSLTLGQY
jgi:hypothetical protein